MSTPQSLWAQKVAADPEHSHRFVQRFRAKAAAGEDLIGEARLLNALVPPRSRLLDAGAGTGRHGGWLATQGHTVVGVDVDPVLVEVAIEDHPDATWLVGDLAELDLPARGVAEPFDGILCAGNVVTFLAPETRREVLRRLADHMVPGGRLAIGFGAGRDYAFTDFFEDAAAAGLALEGRYASWDLRPYVADGEFVVALFARGEA